MKKILWVILWFSVSSSAWANIQAIDFLRLGGYSLLADDLAYLRANSGMFDHWSARWDHADSKEGCLRLLRGASTRIEALYRNSPQEIDLALLLLVVHQYRYNLDDNDTFQAFRDLASETEKRFPSDYRPVWFEALFLSHCGRTEEAIEKFQQILPGRDRLPAVHPSLLLDYSHACYLAGMVRTADIAVRAYLKRTGYRAEDVPLATIVGELVKRPEPSAEYPSEEVWSLSRSDAGIRFSSNLLATSFTVPGDWKLRTNGYKNFQSVCVLTPPAISSPLGKSITINLVVIQSARPTEFPDFVAEFERNLGNGYEFSPADLFAPKTADQTLVRVTNPGLYQDRDGMAGYALFFGNPGSEDGGFNLDVPVPLPKSESQTSYYQVNPQYDRFAVGIQTVVLVDSCVEIAEETDALVDGFLRSLRLE